MNTQPVDVAAKRPSTRATESSAPCDSTATGGSFNQREIKVGGSIPVVDEHIFLGAAVAYLRRDGYGEIVDDGRARSYNRVGQDVSDKDVLAARANATFVWGDSSKLPLSADRYNRYPQRHAVQSDEEDVSTWRST